MKRLFPLALALLLLLSACGTSAPAPSPSPTSTPAPVVEVAPSPTVANVPTLGLTKDAYTAAVDVYLKPQNYITLASLTPTTLEGDKPGVTAYAYTVAQGFSIILSEDTSSKNLTQIFITADKTLISSADMLGFGLVCFASIYQLDGDGGDSIIAKLNMTSNSPPPANIATGANCSYSYLIDDSLVMFQILPE